MGYWKGDSEAKTIRCLSGEEARRNYTIYGKTNLTDKTWHSPLSQEALKITAKLNGQYHTPDEVRQMMAELTASEIDESFVMFPSFYTDCGKNIKIGKRVFINAGCQFQDQGGIEIGDDVLIGPQTIIATLNHDPNPEKRGGMIPKPVKIGDKVWLGARVTICPGVTIGEGAIVGAGAVVTKDVPPRTAVAGVPARVIKEIQFEAKARSLIRTIK